MTSAALESLAIEFTEGVNIARRVGQWVGVDVIEQLIYSPRVTSELLEDDEALQYWLAGVERHLHERLGDDVNYQLAVQSSSDVEDDRRISVIKTQHGLSTERHLRLDFFKTSDYKRLGSLAGTLLDMMGPGAYIQRGEKRLAIRSFKEGLTWLLDEAKRGQHIQRYKGLGEMNPDQLWDTTMNPESRRLLQVRIEDMVGSDDVFTTLMGDAVEPRRIFIEENALAVSNLDV
jgi:Type IIA topoisomerase (DNA gyrase/topo II, topoisomerase IV), B subunit